VDNIIIDKLEKIEEDISDFKIDSVEAERNFTTARLRLCRNPETEAPIVFYSQELNRNFKNPHDPFGRRLLIKTFNASNAMASADVALEHKFQDTILAHKKQIPDYSPLTDIHSANMGLFMDDETATFLSDVGVNIDGLGDDFCSIESVDATPYMEEVAGDAGKLKEELSSLKRGLVRVKGQIASEISYQNDILSLSEDEFTRVLAAHRISDALVQKYLSLSERIGQIKTQLGQASNLVFSETKNRIRLPARLELNLQVA